jgi:hypothetical protein
LDDAITINEDGGCALDQQQLFQPILVIDIPGGICQDGKRQVQTLDILPGFIDLRPEDEQDLIILSLEFRVKPGQLAGMAAALQSIEFAHEKQVDVLVGQVIFQADLSPIGGGQAKIWRT